MKTSEKMFNWDEEWNISFAGCGFRSVYYLGALSCIQEQVPQLVHGAAKIGGASSGCLVAAALTVGIPIEQFCAEVLTMAKEARKHTLGVFHPTFSLLRTVQSSLLQKLPQDAHLRASGRLCVSLTRLADGKNVLVSEFDSREELIQVLMCSCFFPVYCGFIPPSYRGVHYMDGALSNNMPLFEQRNTITMAPFSGESDICPTEGTFNFFEVHYGNVSIQVNTGNVHRVCTSFLPPRPQMLAEICHNGYMDALRFLRERDLLGIQCLPASLVVDVDAVKPACCEQVNEGELTGPSPTQEEHCWLDHRVIENLPADIKNILCEACREGRDGFTWSQLTHSLPVKVVLYVLTILLLPIQLMSVLTKSFSLNEFLDELFVISSRQCDTVGVYSHLQTVDGSHRFLQRTQGKQQSISRAPLWQHVLWLKPQRPDRRRRHETFDLNNHASFQQKSPLGRQWEPGPSLPHLHLYSSARPPNFKFA